MPDPHACIAPQQVALLWQLTLSLCSMSFLVLLAWVGTLPFRDEATAGPGLGRCFNAAVGVLVGLLLLLGAAGVLTDQVLAAQAGPRIT